MKLALLSLFIFMGAALFVASPLLAQPSFCDNLQPGEEIPTFCKETADPSEDPVLGDEGILSKVLNIVSFLLAIVSVFVIIFGGYNMTFSGGNSEAVARGRSMVIMAAAGLAIAVVARAIVALVLNRL